VTVPPRSGVLPVDKGPGITSFQVVAHLRRLLRVSRVGHGGTLDPDATGVLPILVGEATKLTPYLIDLDKEYVATVRLGVRTATQDLSGPVIEARPVPDLDPPALAAVLGRFTGVIRQVPPMYSALHHAGQRLHQLARAGVSVEREPRAVRVFAIHLESIALPQFTIRVTCGKGTYIRTLAADIGDVLGCGAAVARLVRTRVGPYQLKAAVGWDEVREARVGDGLRARILAPDTALASMPAVRLAAGAARRFLHGQAVAAGEAGAGLVRVYAEDGHFLGVGASGPVTVRPERLFDAHPSGTDVPSR
jgi:tRNA pseudouridine55 synthase